MYRWMTNWQNETAWGNSTVIHYTLCASICSCYCMFLCLFYFLSPTCTCDWWVIRGQRGCHYCVRSVVDWENQTHLRINVWLKGLLNVTVYFLCSHATLCSLFSQRWKKKDVCYLNFVPGCDSNFDKCTVTRDQSNSDQLHTHRYVHTDTHTYINASTSLYTHMHTCIHTPSSSVSVCDWLVLVPCPAAWPMSLKLLPLCPLKWSLSSQLSLM